MMDQTMSTYELWAWLKTDKNMITYLIICFAFPFLQGFPDIKISPEHSPDLDRNGNSPSYQAAMCLLEQVWIFIMEYFNTKILHLPLQIPRQS